MLGDLRAPVANSAGPVALPSIHADGFGTTHAEPAMSEPETSSDSTRNRRENRMAEHPLDNPVWASLQGAHAALAEINGGAGRYPADMSPFVGLADPDDQQSWADLAQLAGPDSTVALIGIGDVPAGWEVAWRGEGVQMVAIGFEGSPDPDAIHLGPDDALEMLDLAGRTQPGPFLSRTVEMGTYLGVRTDGALVAMAGERLHPAGWTEISAVCTDPSHRDRGLATRLVGAITAGIRGRGETPFLHVAGSNTNAIRLYQSMGFDIRQATTFTVIRRVEG